jgi:hypothetical protein
MSIFDEMSIYEGSSNPPVIPKASTGDPNMPKVLTESVATAPASVTRKWFNQMREPFAVTLAA